MKEQHGEISRTQNNILFKRLFRITLDDAVALSKEQGAQGRQWRLVLHSIDKTLVHKDSKKVEHHV